VSAPRIGVLALQGAFREHIQAGLDGIVLPGGESTTMDKLLRKFGLKQDLARLLGGGLPALATCAGVILLADEVRDGLADQESLHLLPITVRRNAYGRQPESFETEIEIDGLDRPFAGVFIRAPLVEGANVEVEVLGFVDGRPVAFRCGRIIGLTFHPELTGDDRLHRLFLDDVADAARAATEEETA
jgi:5'-phosphate synthase pdxT subunit